MNNLGQKLSTGNGFLDTGIGSLYGFANAYNNPKGYMFSGGRWLGDGLATSNLSYMENPKYNNYIDQENMLLSTLHNRNGQGQGSFNFRDKFNGALGKLSGLRDNIGEGFNRFMANRRYGDVGDFYNNMEGLA